MVEAMKCLSCGGRTPCMVCNGSEEIQRLRDELAQALDRAEKAERSEAAMLTHVQAVEKDRASILLKLSDSTKEVARLQEIVDDATIRLDDRQKRLDEQALRLGECEKRLAENAVLMAMGGDQTEIFSRYYEEERAKRIAAESRLGSAMNALKNIAKTTCDPWQCAWHALDVIDPKWSAAEKELPERVVERMKCPKCGREGIPQNFWKPDGEPQPICCFCSDGVVEIPVRKAE